MTPSPEPRGSGIWATLRRRKLAEWILAYAATAWSLLQALEYAVDTFHWPESIREISTIAALCGLPIAVVIAWYHGERGEQRVSGVEMLLIALLLLAGGGIVWRYQPAVHDAAPAERLVQTMPGAVTAASVAVLPFRALSTGADDGYFADGLTEEIINALSALDDLLVTARTSAFFFKGKDLPVPEIAATLGVAHVVDGSVRRTGDRVRITAQLIRAADGFNLWSETYEHQAGDAFAIQTRIAASIANALGILLDERKHGQMDRVGVRDVETFVVFQRGVEYFNRAHNEGPLLPLLARANAEFEAALERTPELAQAYFYHADFYAHLLIDVQPGRDRPVALADGLSAEDAEHQLTVDFDAAFRHERDASQRRVIQVLRTTVSHDWRHLGEQIARAYAGWSNCRHGLWIDQTAVVLGYGEAALAHDTRRARCDPIGGDWTREAITAVWLGRAEQGLEAADRIEARRSGQDRDLMHARILAYLALGRHAEAEALYSAGNLDATGATPGIKLLALQIPAAAGRAQEWGRLRPSVENDPLSLLIGAAVFGDRATANRTAAEIDALRLGPAILLRIGDRCGCGAPFDLDATPRFAHQLREAGLAWLPPRPIQFPLKEW